MAQPTRTLPPDNLPMRTHLIEQCVPQLSLADLEAVGDAIGRRWQELKAVQQHVAQEAHFASLRELPEGTPVQYTGPDSKPFSRGEIVPLGLALRKPSTNIHVYDRNGKLWRMPMQYLRCLPTGDSPV